MNLKQNNIIYHPEFISGSHEMLNQVQHDNQDGRSMVEMLGVLAVIGVLSVGGIAGYNSAMKKHRANEILNEASKRAVLVAAQAMTGKTGSISLGEFEQNTFSGVTFADTATVADNKITLGLSGSGLADICAQLKNATGDNTVMKVTQDDCTVLTFNSDMSRGSATGGSNTGSNKGNAGATEDEDGAICSGTRPGPCSVCRKTYADETSGAWYDSDAKCTTGDQICVDGTCRNAPTTVLPSKCECFDGYCGGYGGGNSTSTECSDDSTCIAEYGPCDATSCTKNSNCSNNEYCKFSSVDDETGATAKGDCVANTTGECPEGYICSASSFLNWFSAQNFCRSHNKNLVSASAVGVFSFPCSDDLCGVSWSPFSSDFWLANVDPSDSSRALAIVGNGYNSVGYASRSSKNFAEALRALCK